MKTVVNAPPRDRRRRVPVRPLLLFVMLTPLIPRPTVGGPLSVVAPIALVVLVTTFAAVVAFASDIGRGDARMVTRMFFVLLVPTLIYGFRILAQGQASEEGYFAAKVGMSVGCLAILIWLYASTATVSQIYRAFFKGYCVLAALMIYVGMTGHGIFEPARPPRFYGFRVPFYKAAGIPRSYGELAIFSAAALAYLLVYRRDLRRPIWIGAIFVWVVTEMVAQSRTGFIAGLAVLMAFVGLRLFERRLVACTMVIAVLSIPIAAQWLYPSLQAEALVSDVIGQSTFQSNVDLRLNMYGLALSWLFHPTSELVLFGFSRAHWLTGIDLSLGSPIVLHNYFLSTLMFFGILGGLISIAGLVLLPMWKLARSGLPTRQQEVVFLSSLGMVASLQFYEGFFSLILMWQMALLWYVAYAARGPTGARDPSTEVPTLVAAQAGPPGPS